MLLGGLPIVVICLLFLLKWLNPYEHRSSILSTESIVGRYSPAPTSATVPLARVVILPRFIRSRPERQSFRAGIPSYEIPPGIWFVTSAVLSRRPLTLSPPSA